MANAYNHFFLSWQPDLSQLTKPYYLSLANMLENDIKNGKLLPGTKLPPQRELANYAGINFTTVTRAYELCREKNLIYGITGNGTFVASLPGSETEIAKANSLIDLGIVCGFDHLKKQIIDASEAVLKKGYLEKLYSYSAVGGHHHQKAASVQYLRQFGVNADEEHIALFAGSQNAISCTLLSIFNLGDTIAVDRFTYANLIGTARLAHIRLEPVLGDEFGMIPQALDELCLRKRIAGIFLMPNCANPTGITMSEQRKRDLADVIKTHQLLLIEDDLAPFPQTSTDYHSLWSLLPNQTIYINGAYKYLCGGLRVAPVTFPEHYRERLQDGLFHLNIRISSLDAEIITELILSGKADTLLQEKATMAQRANQIFNRIFPELSQTPHNDSDFFRQVPLPSWCNNAQECERFFAKYGIAVQHSGRFAVGKSTEQNFLRVSISSAGSETRLRTGLSALRFALEQLKTSAKQNLGTIQLKQ